MWRWCCVSSPVTLQVDACYTWWQGAVVALLHRALHIDVSSFELPQSWLDNQIDIEPDVDVEAAADVAIADQSSMLIIDQVTRALYVSFSVFTVVRFATICVNMLPRPGRWFD
jgi:hypothetical protein